MAIAGLAKAERLSLNDALQEVLDDLYDKLFAPIYEQYPDLESTEVEEESPTVGSTLEWDQVSLPPAVTEADVDGVIFSLLTAHWQKTWRFVILAVKRCEKLALPISDEAIAARLRVLSDSDRIEGIGDLTIWSHSEVRLKD